MLLQAFGVSPAVVSQVRNEITPHTQTAQATTTQTVGSPAPASPSVGGVVTYATTSAPTVPPPTCTFSATRDSKIQNHAVFTWQFTQGATGVITPGNNLMFYGDVNRSGPLPFNQGNPDDNFFSYVSSSPTTFTLTVTNAGGTTTCQTTV